MLAGTGAVGALAAYALVRYPGVLRDPAAPAYLVLLGGTFALYVGLAGWEARRPRAGAAFGAFVGLFAGASWSVEIWAGGPAMLDDRVEGVVGGMVALIAVVMSCAARVSVRVRERNPRTAMRAGLLAGLASGIVLFCFAIVITVTNIGVLSTRADYLRQFASGHSHAPDIATFLVGDILAAGIAHLLINLALGLVGGGVGALTARARAGQPDAGPASN